MTIQEVQQQYNGQWVLVEVLQEDELRRPLEVRVLAHSASRDDVYDAMLNSPKGGHIATVFAGDLLQEGYAAAFYVLWK